MLKLSITLKCSNCPSENTRGKELDIDMSFKEKINEFIYDTYTSLSEAGWSDDNFNMLTGGLLCPDCYKSIENKVELAKKEIKRNRIVGDLLTMLIKNNGDIDKYIESAKKEYKEFKDA